MNLSTKVAAITMTSLLLVGGAGATAAFAAEPAAHNATSVSVSQHVGSLKGVYDFSQGNSGTFQGRDAMTSYGHLNFTSGTGSLALDNASGDGIANLTITHIAQAANGTITATVATPGTFGHSTMTLTPKAANSDVYTISGAGLSFSGIELLADNASTVSQKAEHLTGDYQFQQGVAGKFQGRYAMTSYGDIDFTTGNGGLVLDNANGESVANLRITNIDQHANGTITATVNVPGTLGHSTMTMTPSGALPNVYTITGAGLSFYSIQLLAD